MDAINKSFSLVKEYLAKEPTGHDYWHAYRVYNLATYIASKEGGDLLTIQLSAILHDLIDRKIKAISEQELYNFLIEIDKQRADKIIYIIKNLSFSSKKEFDCLEGKIVQDADRLDAIGAIGIARTFATGALLNRPIYGESPNTIEHFYEKLLLLKDKLNTKTARSIAKDRHRFLEVFLERFFKEWELKDIKKESFKNNKVNKD